MASENNNTASICEGGHLKVKSLYKYSKILKLSNEDNNNTQIAEIMGIDRKTVGKYLQLPSPPEYSPRLKPTRVDHFAPFVDRVKELYEIDENMDAVLIFETIQQEGYKGSERTVRRRCAEAKSARPKERFFEQEYLPGDQAQFDFKEKIEITLDQKLIKIYLFFATLPFSSIFFIKAYPRNNFECFIDGVHSFFEHIGGMVNEIRIDNLRPCVSKVLNGNKRIYTSAFEKATSYYGFKVSPCRPYKGSDKGDVEREIRTHARKMLMIIKIKSEKFITFNDLNLCILRYIEQKTLEPALKKFENEKLQLKRFPGRSDEILCRTEMIMASAHGTIKLGDYFYSVPDRAIKCECKVMASAYTIKIFQKDGQWKEVATHDRIYGNSIKLEHILPSLVRKPNAMIRWAHRSILFNNKYFQDLYKYLKAINIDNAESEFLKSINLVQNVQYSELEIGISLVIESKSRNVFNDLKDLLTQGHRPVIEAEYLKQKKIQPNLKGYDKFVPNNNCQKEQCYDT